jgi:hypothetical protein
MQGPALAAEEDAGQSETEDTEVSGSASVRTTARRVPESAPPDGTTRIPSSAKPKVLPVAAQEIGEVDEQPRGVGDAGPGCRRGSS